MKRSFRSSIPVLAVGYGISALVNFGVNVSVGRLLGAAALGAFALAVSISRVFCAATDLGITSQLTRAVARDHEAARFLFPRFLAFRIALVPAAIAVTVVIGRCFGGHQPSLFALVAAAQALVMVQLLYEALFLANDLQHSSALLTVAMSTCIAAGTGAWFLSRGNLVEFGLVYCASTIAAASLWAWRARVRIAMPFSARFDYQSIRRELAGCWPIGASVLLGIGALKAPVLALGAFSNEADVGAFSAVDMFVTATAILQSAVTSATFPRLAASFRHDPPRFRRIFWLSNGLLAAVGLGIGVFLVFFGGRMISLIFPGRDFSHINRLMPIVGWSTPALLLVHHNIFICASADRERLNLALMTVWFVALAGFQLALVPSHGLLGAAWGQLGGRVVGMCVLVLSLFRAGIHRGGDVPGVA